MERDSLIPTAEAIIDKLGYVDVLLSNAVYSGPGNMGNSWTTILTMSQIEFLAILLLRCFPQTDPCFDGEARKRNFVIHDVSAA